MGDSFSDRLWGLNNRGAPVWNTGRVWVSQPGKNVPSLSSNANTPPTHTHPTPAYMYETRLQRPPTRTSVPTCVPSVDWLSGEMGFVLTAVSAETSAFGLNINSSCQWWEITCSDNAGKDNSPNRTARMFTWEVKDLIVLVQMGQRSFWIYNYVVVNTARALECCFWWLDAFLFARTYLIIKSCKFRGCLLTFRRTSAPSGGEKVKLHNNYHKNMFLIRVRKTQTNKKKKHCNII